MRRTRPASINPKPKTKPADLAQQQADFTAEGAPPPGRVAITTPATSDTPHTPPDTADTDGKSSTPKRSSAADLVAYNDALLMQYFPHGANGAGVSAEALVQSLEALLNSSRARDNDGAFWCPGRESSTTRAKDS